MDDVDEAIGWLSDGSKRGGDAPIEALSQI